MGFKKILKKCFPHIFDREQFMPDYMKKGYYFEESKRKYGGSKKAPTGTEQYLGKKPEKREEKKEARNKIEENKLVDKYVKSFLGLEKKKEESETKKVPLAKEALIRRAFKLKSDYDNYLIVCGDYVKKNCRIFYSPTTLLEEYKKNPFLGKLTIAFYNGKLDEVEILDSLSLLDSLGIEKDKTGKLEKLSVTIDVIEAFSKKTR